MVKTVKLRQAGGSLTVTLPKDLTERMNVSQGDELHLIETDRGWLLTPYDPEFQETMEAFEQVNKQYRNAFRELAK